MKDENEVKGEEFTISVNASLKMNLGDYSSGDRGIFLSRKLVIVPGAKEDEKFRILQDETRKLQFMAETQLNAIVTHAMTEMGKDPKVSGYVGEWKRIASASYKAFANKARAMFGVESLEAEAKRKAEAEAAAKAT